MGNVLRLPSSGSRIACLAQRDMAVTADADGIVAIRSWTLPVPVLQILSLGLWLEISRGHCG
jgi:hypothetical protein